MSKVVAILQSNYIPWKGYFDIIAGADEFIVLDDVQYTEHDWRNRNRIKTVQGFNWLTIPIMTKGLRGQTIAQARTVDDSWRFNHLRRVFDSYKRSPYFDEIMSWLAPLYTENVERRLSSINLSFIKAICSYLAIDTQISDSRMFKASPDRTQRLVDLVAQVGGQVYLSGPSAKSYISTQRFDDAGIRVTWADYSGYPNYPQLYGDFVHEVSILDLLFMCGPDSSSYMKILSPR